MTRRRSGKKIDFVHWTGFTEATAAQSAGVVASTAFAAQHDPETLMRTRGNLLAYVDSTSAPGGLIDVGIGMIPVPEGTGATVLWSPITDDDAPWFWIERFSLGYEEAVTDVIAMQEAMAFRVSIDSKAMRILRNQEVQIVYENVTVLTALAFNAQVSGRCLFGT